MEARRPRRRRPGLDVAERLLGIDTGAAGGSLGDLTFAVPRRDRASADGEHERDVTFCRPVPGRRRPGDASRRRTASTDAAWCEKTVQPRTLACAIPARSSAFVSAWRTIATAVRPDGSSSAICSPPPVIMRASREQANEPSPLRNQLERAPDALRTCRRAARTCRAARRRRRSLPACCRRLPQADASSAAASEDDGELSLARSAGAPSATPASSWSGIPSSTAQTPSVIGSSTPIRRERSRSTGAVVSPSTTWPICGLRLVGRRAARDQLAGAPVAAATGASRCTIRSPMPASPENVSGSRAERLAEPRHLDQPARDQRRLRVVAEAEPVDAAGRERDHVLRGGAELDADQVGVHVDAEGERVDRLLQPERERFVLRGDHRRAGQPGEHLLRHVRAGEHRDRPVRGRASRAARRSPGRGP